MTQIYQIGFDRTTYTEQHIRDAQNADDWPEDELQTVEVEPDEITVEGTPEGMRWLYDYFHHLKRAWRLEGEQTDAGVAEGMAKAIWRFTDGELPDQQRPRKHI
jgi:hypothetical protein